MFAAVHYPMRLRIVSWEFVMRKLSSMSATMAANLFIGMAKLKRRAGDKGSGGNVEHTESGHWVGRIALEIRIFHDGAAADAEWTIDAIRVGLVENVSEKPLSHPEKERCLPGVCGPCGFFPLMAAEYGSVLSPFHNRP